MSKQKVEGSSKVVFSLKNDSQKEVLKSIKTKDVSIIYGPAGSGKTFVPVAFGLQELLKGHYDRIVFTRPCVEAYGESLGFLPGDFNEKISPYMMPIFDIMKQFIDKKVIQDLISKEQIATIPLAFQRGISFNNSFVLLDEAQNTIPEQFRMFLTRMGENCKVVITGDPTQNDIEGINGLEDAITRLEGIEQIGIVQMMHDDIVRNPLIKIIDQKYLQER